jgi:hypothetical protein
MEQEGASRHSGAFTVALVLAKREVSGKLACDEEDKLTPDTE